MSKISLCSTHVVILLFSSNREYRHGLYTSLTLRSKETHLRDLPSSVITSDFSRSMMRTYRPFVLYPTLHDPKKPLRRR